VVVLTLVLVLFAVDIPLLFTFSVVRHHKSTRRPNADTRSVRARLGLSPTNLTSSSPW
jgi:hypothetical protein